MLIGCFWPLGASSMNIYFIGCCYPPVSDTDELCDCLRYQKLRNLHLQWGENSIGLIFCIRPLLRPPTPTLSTTSAVQPGVKRPRGILSLSSHRSRLKNKRSFNPHCPRVCGWRGVRGCKMIQPATLIPPYHFRLHIKNTPHPPTKQRSCVLDPNVQILKSKKEQRNSCNNRAE